MIRVLSAVLLTFALAVAAGCGDDDNPTAGTATTPPVATTPETTASGPASTPTENPAEEPDDDDGGEVEVEMENIQFDPVSVTVKVGQTVKWVNEDTVPHNVIADDDKFPPSDNFNKGESYTYKTDTPGTFKYTCTIHPGMDGTLIVK